MTAFISYGKLKGVWANYIEVVEVLGVLMPQVLMGLGWNARYRFIDIATMQARLILEVRDCGFPSLLEEDIQRRLDVG